MVSKPRAPPAWAQSGTSAPGRPAGAGGNAEGEGGASGRKGGRSRWEGREEGAGLRPAKPPPPAVRGTKGAGQVAAGSPPDGAEREGGRARSGRASAAASQSPHLQVPSLSAGTRESPARGGGGQCETGWCCCARVCSGPRCTSGCGCAPRRPPAPPGPALQVRFGEPGELAAAGWVGGPARCRGASPGIAGGGGRAKRDGPQTKQTALFILGALTSGKLEGAFLSSCPRHFSPPRFP